jgi:hypothetical protein
MRGGAQPGSRSEERLQMQGGAGPEPELSPGSSRTQEEGTKKSSGTGWCWRRWVAELAFHALLNYYETCYCRPSLPLFADRGMQGSRSTKGTTPQRLGRQSVSDAPRTIWRTPRGFGSTTERGSAGDTCRGSGRQLQSMTSTRYRVIHELREITHWA